MSDLAAWRARTYYAGIQVCPGAGTTEYLELRNGVAGSTEARLVAVTSHCLDGDVCQCMGCGCAYHAERGHGDSHTGTHCSLDCLRAWAEAAGIWCVDCGIERPRELGPDGGRCGCYR